MNIIPIYPIINIREHSDGSPNTITVHHFVAETLLRVNHDGKWYLTRLSEERHIPDSDQVEYEKRRAIQNLHSAAYFHVFCAKISLNSVLDNVDSAYVLDKDQRSESERLLAIFLTFKMK